MGKQWWAAKKWKIYWDKADETRSVVTDIAPMGNGQLLVELDKEGRLYPALIAAGWLPPNPKRRVMQGQFNTNSSYECECHYFGERRECAVGTCLLGISVDELFDEVDGKHIRLIIEPIEEGS